MKLFRKYSIFTNSIQCGYRCRTIVYATISRKIETIYQFQKYYKNFENADFRFRIFQHGFVYIGTEFTAVLLRRVFAVKVFTKKTFF